METSIYAATLNILRNITSSRKGPQTTVAKSRVILKSNLNKDSKPTEYIESGSFKINYPKYFQNLSRSDHNFTLPNDIKLPLGNELFLESELSREMEIEKGITKQNYEYIYI